MEKVLTSINESFFFSCLEDDIVHDHAGNPIEVVIHDIISNEGIGIYERGDDEIEKLGKHNASFSHYKKLFAAYFCSLFLPFYLLPSPHYRTLFESI